MTFHFTTCHSYLMLHGEMLFSRFYLESKMGDSLEARISTVEHIQEEFGHDIQEMKRQLARLTKLIEGHIEIVPEDIHGSHSIHCHQARILWYNIFILIMNLRSQSGATFHREFTTRIGSPMRLLRQSFQLLGKCPNLLI